MSSRAEATFFEDPSVCGHPPGNFGILHLLRRDINRCMEGQILWPGAMAILAGIDLLGKFVAGDDIGQVGRRFKTFVAKYFHVSECDAEALYELRNALLHSFGLFSQSKKQTYRFQLSEGDTSLVTLSSSGAYVVQLGSLHIKFEKAVAEYRSDLERDSDLQLMFAAMYPKYGSIPIS